MSAQSLAQQRAATKAAVIDSSLAEPINVTPLALKTGKTRFARNASARGEWLNQPVVQIENTSGKAVEYLALEITLPGAESLPGQSPMMLAYGQAPGRKFSSQPSEALQPGAKVNLTFSRNACEAVTSRLLASGTRPPSGSRVRTRINGVVFADGTAWFDGLPHVADRSNPLRWNVVEKSSSRADSIYAPFFEMSNASYRLNPAPAPRRAPCWKRLGTQWVECCGGLQVASAVLVQVWGGLYEPFVMHIDCEDGSSCEWVKQVGCTSDPQGEVP
jgi:hypothetical protein